MLADGVFGNMNFDASEVASEGGWENWIANHKTAFVDDNPLFDGVFVDQDANNQTIVTEFTVANLSKGVRQGLLLKKCRLVHTELRSHTSTAEGALLKETCPRGRTKSRSRLVNQRTGHT